MGFFDWAGALLSDANNLIKGAAVVVAAAIFISAAVKSRGGIVAMILSGIAGGFIIWAVTLNGLGFFSNTINEETNAVGMSQTVGD